ncbi:hypothetical protein IAF28_20475, partial [Acinetobacter baumannii]|nr:hypothetical protein [Acinetobacter baumannii]
GDDSPWRTWQRVEEETEMRNLIASELRKIAQNKYSTSQENELSNCSSCSLSHGSKSPHDNAMLEAVFNNQFRRL